MRRALHKLSDQAVKAERHEGRHSDGGGLYLNVTANGSRSWLFMWSRGGKRREMGLGAYPALPLAKARAKAAECRAAVGEGRDPIRERDQAPEPTFGQCADQYIATIKSEWRNAKHEYQWTQTLRDRCASIRDKRISEINTQDVLGVITPLWLDRNETASRLRGRIERVLNYAKVKGWRTGENPAAWRGHLQNTLPKRQKLSRGHFPALPYAEVPAFLAKLSLSESMAARALEFTILTAARSWEALGARWEEIDLEESLWTVPAERMKAAEDHMVPLSPKATEILHRLREGAAGPYVFPSAKPVNLAMPAKPLSNMVMLMLLRRMDYSHITVHGFRSSFRDWCGDQTSFPREVAEAALAHKVGNEVERAYRRTTALAKRRKLMHAWEAYCLGGTASNVVAMQREGGWAGGVGGRPY